MNTQRASRPPCFWSCAGANLVIALLYYGLAELSRNLAATPNAVTPVWPSDGLAVGATLLYGNWVLPGVCLGSFLANIQAFWSLHHWQSLLISVFGVLGIAGGTTLGTWLGTVLLRRTIRQRYPFNRVADTIHFLVYAGLIGPIVNATVGVAMVVLTHKSPWSGYGEIWLIWWVSNVAGIFILTPVLLSWSHWMQSQPFSFHPQRFRVPISGGLVVLREKGVEALVLAGFTLFIGKAAFWDGQPLAYMLIPLLVWAAFRLGQPGTTLIMFLTATIAIAGTVRGLGTFAEADLNQSLVSLQSFTTVVVFTSLVLVAVLAEQREAESRLKNAFTELQVANTELETLNTALASTNQELILASEKIAAQQAALLQAEQARSRSAAKRSQELERANSALQNTVAALADRRDLEGFIGEVLHTIAREFESPVVEYWQTLAADTVEVHTWLYDNRLFSLKQNDSHPGRGGIRLLPEYIDFGDFTHRSQLFVLDAPIPAYSLALGEVICPTEWYAEQGVSRHFNFPLQVGNITVGAISVWLPLNRQITEECLRLGQALSHQTALAIQLTQLAEEAKQAAVAKLNEVIAREQEQVAQERAMLLERINFVLQRSSERLSAAADPQAIIVETLRTSAEVLAPLGVKGIGLVSYQPTSRTLRVMVHILDGVEQTIAGSDLDGDWSVDSPAMIIPWRRIQSENFVWGLTSDTTVLVPEVRHYHESRGARAIAYVPLRRGEEAVGFIGFDLASEMPPTQQQVDMIRALTSQVLLAVEMERLSEAARKAAIGREQEKAAQERAAELTQLNQALQAEVVERQRAEHLARRQTAALSQIVNALTRNMELNAILTQVMKVVVEQFNEHSASLWWFWDIHDAPTDYLSLDYENGTVKTGEQCWHPATVDRQTGSRFWQIIKDIREPFVMDVQTDPRLEDYRAFLLGKGIQTVLNVPLFRQGDRIGTLTLRCRQQRDFQPEEIDLILALAQQAMLAIQLTQLAEEAKQGALAKLNEVIAREQEKVAQEQAAELAKANKALRRSLNAIAIDADPRQIIAHILKIVAEQFETPLVEYWTHTPADRTAHLSLTYHQGKFLNPHDQPGHPGNADFPCFPKLIDDQRSQQPSYFLIEEIASDPNIIQASEQIGIDAGAWFTARGVTRLLNIPLWLNEQTIGALDIWLPRDRSFSRSQIELAYTFGQQITLATYLNQLFEDAKQTVLFEERNRMAREIHDTLAQSFTSIGMQLEAATRFLSRKPEQVQSCLSYAQELARSGLAEARRSVWALQSEAEDYRQLAATLQQIAAQRSAETAIPIEVAIVGTPHTLPADVGMNLLRIAQEALNNAICHAQAQTILLTLTYAPDQMQLQIQDNGQGFDPQLKRNSGGFGLLGMQQRCDRLGAVLSITSRLGYGTEVMVTIPI